MWMHSGQYQFMITSELPPPMRQSSIVADSDSLVEVIGTELAESDALVLVEIHLHKQK